MAMFNAAAALNRFTRFAGELFGMLITILFMQEAIKVQNLLHVCIVYYCLGSEIYGILLFLNLGVQSSLTPLLLCTKLFRLII
jgi:hypothetical protein